MAGFIVARFLNACIDRIPLGLPVLANTSVPSRTCSDKTAEGRASSGHTLLPLSVRHGVVDILVPLLFVTVCMKFMGPTTSFAWVSHVTNIYLLPIYLVVVSGMVVASFIDIEHLIITDRLTVGGVAFELLLSSLIPEIQNETAHISGLQSSVAGAVAGFFSLWFVSTLGRYVFRKEAMGFGDVNLMAAVGALFGW